MPAHTFNIGYFLKVQHFEKALLLLKKQLDEKNFTFKTIDFEIFRKETNYSSFNVSEFYNEFIEKDIFYNYHLAFYTNHYSIPKGIFGVRKFQFSSFQMLLIYYAIGFYFYEILNETFISINEVK